MAPSQLHTALHPVGPEAARIAVLWHQLAITATVVFVVVIAALLFGLTQRERSDGNTAQGDRGAERIVMAAVGLTVIVLLLFVGASYSADRAVASSPTVPPIHIHITGHEWWWEVEYTDSVPDHTVLTANEIHVPVGRPVTLELTSNDVIHSFWIPSVGGKTDLIPGRTNWHTFQVDTAGVYGGACAEFCGLEHAKMRLTLIAERPDEFAHWMATQHADAMSPSDSEAARGQRLFVSADCAVCHTVRGTPANATVGPDLTHLASRRTIAAGILDNNDAGLAAWIAAAPRIKPGTLMPATLLSAQQERALVAYLRTLK